MSFGLFEKELELPVGLKPNLAGKYLAEKQKFPCFASPKIDGFRALGTRVGLLSRTLKLLPNRHTQERFKNCNGLDGEVVFGNPFAKDCMQATSSAVTTHAGQPDTKYYVFDRWDMPGVPYKNRLKSLYDMVLPSNVIRLIQVLIHNLEELIAYEAKCLEEGYEGIMVRDPEAMYKKGRSTTNEGGLLKVKRFEDAEAKVIGYTELRNVDGIPQGVLGALLCQTPDGVEFGVGTGFSAAQRAELWAIKETLPGRIVRYKHFAASGVKVAPRFPVFFGFRSLLDIL